MLLFIAVMMECLLGGLFVGFQLAQAIQHGLQGGFQLLVARFGLAQAVFYLGEAVFAVQQALADQDVARKQLRNDPNASDLALKKPQVAQARAMRQAAAAAAIRACAWLSASR